MLVLERRQISHQGDESIRTIGGLDVRDVLAVDHEPRHPVDAVALDELVPVLKRRLHGEGMVGLLELVLRDAELDRKGGLDLLGLDAVARVRRHQGIPALVDLLEDFLVNLIDLVARLTLRSLSS